MTQIKVEIDAKQCDVCKRNNHKEPLLSFVNNDSCHFHDVIYRLFSGTPDDVCKDCAEEHLADALEDLELRHILRR